MTREWALAHKDEILSTIEIAKRQDAVALQKPNLFQKRFYKALSAPLKDSLTVVLALKPNRVGGTWAMVSAWKALMWGTEHACMQGPPFGHLWPFPLKSARLFSSAEALADVGPIQTAVAALFPKGGRYEQNRGVGKSYSSAGTALNGWNWDAFSYGQDAQAAAGANKSLILMSEPPPRSLFVEGITRLSGSGLVVIECTQLEFAPWLEQMAEEAGGPVKDGIQYGSLRLDDRRVGEIRVVRGNIHDACREHCDGHLAHSAIESMIAAWPEEERAARSTGCPMRLSGRVYPNWCDANEIEEFDDYYLDCIERGQVRLASVIDPHDRKPWACTWWAGFPNEDIVGLAEWPPFDFNACKSSPISKIERYRDIIIETEAALGRPVDTRIIDGKFGASIKSGKGLNVIQMLSLPCPACEEKKKDCKHRMTYRKAPAYDGSVRDGHMIVRAHIGEEGSRAKIRALRPFMPNFCRGMRRYAFRERSEANSWRGVSETPEYVEKDFPDNVRMLMQSRFHIWPAEPAPAKIIPRRER